MTVLAIVAGLLLIGLALHDILHELFHPGGSGAIARHVMRLVWAVGRRIGRRVPSVLPLAGPVTLVTILALWAFMLALGWALIYWPFLPDAFRFASSLEPQDRYGLLDAIYVSLVGLSTLGFGDITPTRDWMRIVATLQGFVGFGLLTAGISWILMLYPILTRRRAFAARVLALEDAAYRTGVRVTEREPSDLVQLLDDLAAQLTVLRADLTQSPISYYFHDNDPGVALSRALPRVAVMTAAPDESSHRSVRHAAATLAATLDGLAALIGRAHLDMPHASTDSILEAFSRAHPHEEDGDIRA